MRADRVLVLGGTGFLGRHITAALRDAGRRVTSVARTAAPGVVSLDVAAGEDEVAGLIARIEADAVVNAAGALWGGVSEEQIRHSNVLLVERLLGAVERLPHPPRVIQLGTVHEYGSIPTGVLARETDPLRPVSAYGRSKARATELVTSAGAGNVVLRVANVIGAGMPQGSLFGKIVAELAAGGPRVLELHPLTSRRDFVDARDVAAAVLAAADTPEAGPVLNIGGGSAVSVRGLVTRLIEVSGVAVEVRERAPSGPVPPGGAAEWQALDTTIACGRLNWKPRYSPEESLQALWSAAEKGAVRE